MAGEVQEERAAIVLAGRRILVVEDEIMIAMMVEDMLEEIGCCVAAVATRHSAAEEAIESGGLDAAILDINLNGGTSFYIARALAARGIPFLFSTGYGESATPPEFRDRPVLGKPFAQAELRTKLSSLFSGATGSEG